MKIPSECERIHIEKDPFLESVCQWSVDKKKVVMDLNILNIIFFLNVNAIRNVILRAVFDNDATNSLIAIQRRRRMMCVLM